MIKQDGAFGPSAFSVSKLLHTANMSAMVDRVADYVANPFVHLVPGFFNESLTSALVQQRRMRPALYVDIDTDICASPAQHAPAQSVALSNLCHGVCAQTSVRTRRSTGSAPTN